MRWKVTSCLEFDAKVMEIETITSEFSNGGRAIVEKILTSEEGINSKELDCESHSQRSK